ncbi:MAG: carbon-nitrogen hydrolase family protein [Gammaproteobacteria bacterium]|nr:carbon-nitrogen hydrolase family protein [Gammaproteobacteria bacterium]
MTPFTIAGIQMHIENDDNIPAMEARLDQLMSLYPWIQMVLFSELAPYGSNRDFAQPMPGPAEQSFQAMAIRHGIWLIPGSYVERSDGRLYNSSPIIDPRGNVVARYRKMFPFYPYEEGISPGDQFCVFDVRGVGRFALTNCYDIWFPETTRTLVGMGAEVLLHPVMTTYVDRDIDIVMAHAAAASNQIYVFDINGLGAGGVGKSCVIDPSARFLHQSGSHEEFIPIEIDFDQVRRQRIRGIRNLGQPLKSFRDRPVEFPVYSTENDTGYLDSLGELAKPRREN